MRNQKRSALRVTAAALLVLSGLTVDVGPARAADNPWTDPSQPPSQRADELLAAMTQAEKLDHDARRKLLRLRRCVNANTRLGIPPIHLQDGPVGVGDGLTGVTQLPAPVAGAATWDTAADAAVRAGARRRAVGQGHQRRARPDHQHRPRPALGPGVRVVRRGPVPDRAGRRRRHPGHPEPGPDGAGQALRRLQPGDQPQHAGRQRDRLRPDHAGDLPAGLRDGREAGRRRLGDVLLLGDQRRRSPARTARCRTASSRATSASAASSPRTGAPPTPRWRPPTTASTWRCRAATTTARR